MRLQMGEKWSRKFNKALSEKLLIIERPYGQKYGAENGKEKKKNLVTMFNSHWHVAEVATSV